MRVCACARAREGLRFAGLGCGYRCFCLFLGDLRQGGMLRGIIRLPRQEVGLRRRLFFVFMAERERREACLFVLGAERSENF